MNSQQYNRANKRVFLAVIIVFAYIAFTLFAAVGTKDADITRISIQLVAAIAVIVIAVIAFITKKKRQQNRCAYTCKRHDSRIFYYRTDQFNNRYMDICPAACYCSDDISGYKDDDGDERSNNHIQRHQACNAAWNRGYSSSE